MEYLKRNDIFNHSFYISDFLVYTDTSLLRYTSTLPFWITLTQPNPFMKISSRYFKSILVLFNSFKF